MKLTELVVGLAAVSAQTDKSHGEVVAAVAALNEKIGALEAKVAELLNGELSPEIVAAFNGLKASVQAIDDLNADATPPTV